MIIDTNIWNSPVRKISAKVELLEGSTQVGLYSSTDRLKSFSVERVGDDSKFFGFGVCQRLNVHLIDTMRELDYGTQHSVKCYLNDLDAFPGFKITEIHRNENTNEMSITAYDALYEASKHKVIELVMNAPYTIRDVANKCIEFLGISGLVIIGVDKESSPFDTNYPEGANFEGTETLRDTLNAIAEVTQTVYYIDQNNNLVFKRPDRDGDTVLTITKADYIKLDSKTNRRLSDICSATELGDNVITESGIIGTVQYVRDNPFWELRSDIVGLLNNALAAIGNLTINQFDCSWRGNPALEIGDKIALITKNNDTVISYIYDDKIEYDGSLKQTTRWNFSGSDSESLDNPVSLGETLKKTYAKVDKANREIEIVASQVEGYDAQISSLRLDTESINAAVQQTQINSNEAINALTGSIETLTTEVSTKITSEEMSIAIQREMENGVDRITTGTGYTFNDEGLTVSKTGTDVTTTITEDGMTVYKKNEEMLVANNEGVVATDLHARTYLIIGTNSRIEDMGSDRTGVFWIGG